MWWKHELATLFTCRCIDSSLSSVTIGLRLYPQDEWCLRQPAELIKVLSRHLRTSEDWSETRTISIRFSMDLAGDV